MHGIQRKVVYVSLYEGFAILFASIGLAPLSGADAATSTMLAVLSSVIAVLWKLGLQRDVRGLGSAPDGARTLGPAAPRLVRALGFEGGVAAILVPVFAWWLGVGWWEALLFDAALLVFFLVYPFVFNWRFDRLFGFPAAATQGAGQGA